MTTWPFDNDPTTDQIRNGLVEALIVKEAEASVNLDRDQTHPVGEVTVIETPPSLPNEMPWDDEYYDTETTAYTLKVTPNNLRQMTFKKLITVHHRQGRKSFYAKADVIALAEKRAQIDSTPKTGAQ